MADLALHQESLNAAGGEIVAVSSDPEGGARRVADELDLDYTLLYDLDAEEAEDSLGLYTGTVDGEPHVQPAGFVLSPDGTVTLAVYSSGKVGRLSADDAMAALEAH